MPKTISHYALMNMGACEAGLDWWEESYGFGNVVVTGEVLDSLPGDYLEWFVVRAMPAEAAAAESEYHQTMEALRTRVYREYLRYGNAASNQLYQALKSEREANARAYDDRLRAVALRWANEEAP